MYLLTSLKTMVFDLQYVIDVAKTIAETMKDPKIIVTKSTVPVGSAQ